MGRPPVNVGTARVRRAVGTARVMAMLGPRTSAAVWASTLRTVSADRRLRRAARARLRRSEARTPGVLVSMEPLTERRRNAAGRLGRPVTVGALCRFAEATLELRFLADDLVRASWGPGDPPPPWALAGFDPLSEGPGDDGGSHGGGGTHGGGGNLLGPPRRVTVDADARIVGTAHLTVRVGEDGSLRYRWRGKEVRTELPPVRRGPHRSLRCVLRPGEAVAGLGEQAGPVDLAGTAHRLWARDPGGTWGPGEDPLYLPLPVLVFVHPEGNVLAFAENPHDGSVRVRPPGVVGRGSVEIEMSGGMLRHFVTVGSLATLTERYSALTGRPAMPPRWALGYHHSRWGWRTQGEVAAVASGFAADGLPLSAVYLDIDHMDGYRVFTVDPQRFGNLAGLTATLARRGTRTVAIVDPAVKVDPAYDVYREGLGHFVQRPPRAGAAGGGGAQRTATARRTLHGAQWAGTAAFCDFTDPDARRWWAGLYHRLLDNGVAGVWHDMNEPTSMAFAGDRTLPLDARHGAEGEGADHRACHNVYGSLMAHTGAAALRRERPGHRPFVLSRSGWAGVQRSAWHWTGDSESTWAALAQQVATVVNLGLSGVGFCGADVGGFSGDPGPELYVRWLELSVLLPLCRTHSASVVPPREPWRLPEPYRAAAGRLIRFRYRLLPALYTLAHEAATTGHPPVRPAGWPDGLGRADGFLLGDALFAAPVVAPGASRRDAALPAGRWVRFPGDGTTAPARVAGRVTLGAAPGAPVLLARAGSVVPLDDGWPGVPEPGDHGLLPAGHAPRLLAFHCVPDEAGEAEGACYDDAGDGDGPGRIDRLTLRRRGGGATLSWARAGGWPAPARVRVVTYGVEATAATADGVAVAVRRSPGRTVVECGPFDRLELR